MHQNFKNRTLRREHAVYFSANRNPALQNFTKKACGFGEDQRITEDEYILLMKTHLENKSVANLAIFCNQPESETFPPKFVRTTPAKHKRFASDQ